MLKIETYLSFREELNPEGDRRDNRKPETVVKC